MQHSIYDGRRIIPKLSISIIITAVVLIVSLFNSKVSEAATYYAGTNEKDSNLETEAQPFQILAKGVSVLKPGDTLIAGTGTYAESLYCGFGVNVCISGGSSWNNPATPLKW